MTTSTVDHFVATVEPRCVWYKFWAADLLECKSCGHQLLVRSESQGPIAVQHEAVYASKVQRYGSMLFVEDC
jgi:hypothetical protein